MESDTDLRIHLFGPLQIRRHGRTLPLPASLIARSLLAYLLLHPQKQHARAALLGVFWPDMPEAEARRMLTQALWQIRRVVPELVQADRATISLNKDTAVFVDVLAFQELLGPSQPPETTLTRLRQAVGLAQGELLEGFYDDWIFPERERLREQYLRALEQLAQIEKQNGRYQQALAAISQLTQADPLRESAWQEQMRLHAALGQPEAALQQYAAYRRILAEELDAQPQPATIALAQAIARQSGSQPVPFVPAPAGPLDPPALNAAASLPLIGRARERDALLRQITAVLNRQGGVIFISGEAGAGKSRLLQEVAEAAAWRGAPAAWGYAQDQAAAPPFGPLTQALDAALSPLRIQQIRRLLPELWLAAAAQLLPEITAVLPHLPPLTSLPPDQEPMRQLEALTRLTLALGEIAPQLIILEDLHWADQNTLDALTYLARRLADSRILLLGSFRQEEAQENEGVWRGLQAIEAAGLRLRLRLTPLAADSVAELVRQGLDMPDIAPRFSQRIYRQCGGNPFHVLETLRALHDNGLLYRDEQGGWHTPYDDATNDYAELPIPAVSEQVIRQRLDRLSPEAQLTAQTAALIGREVDFLLLETAVPLETRQTLAALGVLVQRQFLQETAVGYQFSHDQIRHTLLGGLSSNLAQELHGRIAVALEQYQPDQPEQLAWHYAAAENAEKAIRYNQAAAARARQNHALQTALDYLNQAIRFRPPDDLLYALLTRREELHNTLARREAQANDLAQMDKLARMPQRQIETRLRYARWHMEQSRFVQARQEAAAAKEIAEQIGDTAAIGQAEMVLYDAIYTQSGDIEAARVHLERARACFRAAGDDNAEADTWLAESRLLRGASDYDQAAAILQKALRQRQAAGDLPAQEYIHWQLGTIGMEQGNAAQSDRHFRRALELAQTIGHRYREAVIHVNWGNLLWMQGKFPRTLEHYREALNILAETGQRRAEAQILANLASMQCALLGDYETSTANANKSLAYYREVGDEIGIGQALSILGQIALNQQDWAASRRYLAESAEFLAHVGEKFIRVQVYRTLAQLAVEEKNPAAGWEPLTEAEQLCREAGIASLQASIMALRGLLLLEEGQWPAALEATTEAVNSLMTGSDQAYLIYYWHSLALEGNGRAAEAAAAIEKAYQLLQKAINGLTPEQQERSLNQIPEHRQIVAAWQVQQARKQTVWLPPANAPSRSVAQKDLIAVAWTPHLPEDDRVPGKKARRQHQLRRLLAEAEAQGAAAPIYKLAQALKVSEGTIKRDLAALRGKGEGVRE